MNYKVIKNFLDKDKFIKIKDIVTGEDFPWFHKSNNEIEGGYFSHALFHNNDVNSTFNKILTSDIYEVLNPVAVIGARANLLLSSLFCGRKSKWHTDYDNNNFTAIYYLNSTDGGTEVKDNNDIKFIKAEENKLLVMKGHVLHRALPSPDVEKRYILNFNYFETI